MITLSVHVIGREIFTVRLGELEQSSAHPPEHPVLEAGSGGQFDLSEPFGFYSTPPCDGTGLTQVRRAPPA